MPWTRRRLWSAALWHRLSWGLAFTPLVFAVLVSVDVTAALAVAVAFAPEAVVGVAVLALLFLLGRRIVRGVRGLPKEDGH